MPMVGEQQARPPFEINCEMFIIGENKFLLNWPSIVMWSTRRGWSGHIFRGSSALFQIWKNLQSFFMLEKTSEKPLGLQICARTRPCTKSCISSGIMRHVLVKQTSGTGFQWERPQILSGYRRRFRLLYRTDNKEIEVDLSGFLGMCILTWVKFSIWYWWADLNSPLKSSHFENS
jgi:hypothetical protein